MMIRMIILSCALLLALQSSAQSFYDYYQKGDSLLRANDAAAALDAYAKAFEIREGTHPMFYINPASAAAYAGETDQAISYLEVALEKGLDDPATLTRGDRFRPVKETDAFNAFLAKVEERYAQQEEALRKELEGLMAKDQMIRRLAQEVDTAMLGAEGMAAFAELFRLQDSVNQIAATRILMEHGWVGTSRVGQKANQALWLIVQHAPLKMQEEYLPLLQKSVEEEETPAKYLAFLEDRIAVQQENPQKYGTQLQTDPQTGETTLYPLADPEKVDEMRENIGLEPLEDYLRKMGAKRM